MQDDMSASNGSEQRATAELRMQGRNTSFDTCPRKSSIIDPMVSVFADTSSSCPGSNMPRSRLTYRSFRLLTRTSLCEFTCLFCSAFSRQGGASTNGILHFIPHMLIRPPNMRSLTIHPGSTTPDLTRRFLEHRQTSQMSISRDRPRNFRDDPSASGLR